MALTEEAVSMSAVRIAVEKVGGVTSCARICQVTPPAVRKWLHRGRLPRTEYTGETQHAKRMAAASDGAFTAEWLLENAGPAASEPQVTPTEGAVTSA
ncbi:hypothetical protein R5R73_04765 [Salinicola sp. LHM]|uniref:hypothetical protein n=1 Tax=Salinicola sp. LHM TaxID=3065298 RepID=UPI002ACE4ECF|nr:hypothetical protein [Salinicola sp. LHM]WQH34001.1 hypothetical protein R5R73_04765 [Salinicola sp. LHM]